MLALCPLVSVAQRLSYSCTRAGKFRQAKQNQMLRNEAVKQISAALYRLVKGITGNCIVQWKDAKRSDFTKELMQNAALSQLAGVFARLVKGELYGRIVSWKLEARKGSWEKGDRVREAALKYEYPLTSHPEQPWW